MDITKCADEDCPMRETCWRWLAPAGESQSYFIGRRKDDECEDYWQINPEEVYVAQRDK